MTHSALAIGNFDGVHLGHRRLLADTILYAKAHGLQPSVLTFDPHPTAVVAPGRVPLMLTSLPHRLRLLREAGIENICVLPFTSQLAVLTPTEFARQILVDSLHAKAVFVGENFRFGARKQGSPEVLRALGTELGFQAHFLSPVTLQGQVVSSTLIRQYLAECRIHLANRLLGRCFALAGPVVSGHGIGSRQTVPTLNLKPPAEQLVPRGVFITETIDLHDGRRWQSITNAGTRPTFQGDELTVETFLLSPFEPPDPAGISVQFHRFVRAERAFPDPASLREQILRDVSRANAYWRRVKRLPASLASIY